MSITDTVQNQIKSTTYSNQENNSINTEKLIFRIIKTKRRRIKNNLNLLSINSSEIFLKNCFFQSRFRHQNEICINSIRKVNYDIFNFSSFTTKQSLNKKILREFRKYLIKSNLNEEILNISYVNDFINKKLFPPFTKEYKYQYYIYDENIDIDLFDMKSALSSCLFENEIYFKSINNSFIIWLFEFKIFYILFSLFINEKFEHLFKSINRIENFKNLDELYYYIKNFHHLYRNDNMINIIT